MIDKVVKYNRRSKWFHTTGTLVEGFSGAYLVAA